MSHNHALHLDTHMPTDYSMGQVMEDFKRFFGIDEMPFTLLPNTQYYVALPDYQQCLAMLSFALNCSEGIIKVTGEVGVGKTMVCRRLLNSINEDAFYTAYIPNPNLTSVELKRAVAKELQVPDLNWIAEEELMEAINKRLIKLAQNNKKVVLVIDEAQALPMHSIETLRLLTNLETEQQKLMQIVLFAQPELDDTLSKYEIRQIRQRITYSYHLKPLNRLQTEQYILQRMAIAGYQGATAYSASAITTIFKYSQGIPRLISILCSKSMLIAFSKGEREITKAMIKKAALDTEGVDKPPSWFF